MGRDSSLPSPRPDQLWTPPTPPCNECGSKAAGAWSSSVTF